MAITFLPTQTEGSGPEDLGGPKSDDDSYDDPTHQLSSVNWNSLILYIIALATEVGLSDGSTAGSLRKALNDFITSVTDGSAILDVAELSVQSSLTATAGIINDLSTGALNGSGIVKVYGTISPAQITSDQTTYNPTDLGISSVLRVSTDALRNIRSLANGIQGKVLILLNIGSFPLVLSHEYTTGTTASNRFTLPGGADLTIHAGGTAVLWYDNTSSRWRAASSTVDFGEAGDITTIGTANAAGSTGEVADAGHTHNHGAQTDQSHHALATRLAHGFLAALDYDRMVGESKIRVTVFRTSFGELYTSYLSTTLSGTGTSVSQTAVGLGPSVLIAAGTTTTGAAALRQIANQFYNGASNVAEYYLSVLAGIYDGLPDGTDNFTVMVAAFTNSSFTTDGVGFIYDHTVSANWQFFKLAASVFTYVDTGVAATGNNTGISTFKRFTTHVVGGGAGGTATGYIDGVQVGQFVASLPTISAGYMVPYRIVKTLGTNNRRGVAAFAEGWYSPTGGSRP